MKVKLALTQHKIPPPQTSWSHLSAPEGWREGVILYPPAVWRKLELGLHSSLACIWNPCSSNSPVKSSCQTGLHPPIRDEVKIQEEKAGGGRGGGSSTHQAPLRRLRPPLPTLPPSLPTRSCQGAVEPLVTGRKVSPPARRMKAAAAALLQPLATTSAVTNHNGAMALGLISAASDAHSVRSDQPICLVNTTLHPEIETFPP